MRLMVSRWLIGIWNISDVERIVTTRVDEAASAPALKPSRTARSAANRKTAIATLITVSSVRRLLRLALFNMRPRNFTSTSYPTRLRSLAPNELRRGRPALYTDPLPNRLLSLYERPFFEVQDAFGALRGVRIVRHHHNRLLVLVVQPLQQREYFARRLRVEVAGRLVGEKQRRI